MTDAKTELAELRKKVPFKQINETTLISGACQCAFPHVFEMHANKMYPDSKPEASISLLVPKDDPFAKACMMTINKLMTGKYGEDKAKWPDDWKKPISDGDKKADKYPEMAGHYVIKCNNKRDLPMVLDAAKNEIMDAREIYPGCVVRVKFNAFISKKFHAVGFGLTLVQKIADAEPFGGAAAPETGDDLDDLDLPAAKTAGDDVDFDF